MSLRPRGRFQAFRLVTVFSVIAALLVSPGVALGTTATVEPYRPVPGAAASGDYRVSVDGHPVFVNAYKDIAYASFGFDKPVSVTVSRANESMAGARLLPEGAGRVGYGDDAVTIALSGPANLVLTVPQAPRLFLFADSLGANPGAPSGGTARDVADLGVDPAGASVQTAGIQRAIDTVARQGGGTVYFPPGRYVIGTLNMRSHVTLYLADGAVIQGSGDPADYPVDPGRTEVGTDGRTMTFSRLIYFDHVQNAGIAGRGVIDGDGKRLRQTGRPANLIRVVGSSNVQLSNVVLRDSAAWNTHVLNSRNVQITNVRIVNDTTNPTPTAWTWTAPRR